MEKKYVWTLALIQNIQYIFFVYSMKKMGKYVFLKDVDRVFIIFVQRQRCDILDMFFSSCQKSQ